MSEYQYWDVEVTRSLVTDYSVMAKTRREAEKLAEECATYDDDWDSQDDSYARETKEPIFPIGVLDPNKDDWIELHNQEELDKFLNQTIISKDQLTFDAHLTN